jgi:hypothetical protein
MLLPEYATSLLNVGFVSILRDGEGLGKVSTRLREMGRFWGVNSRRTQLGQRMALTLSKMMANKYQQDAEKQETVIAVVAVATHLFSRVFGHWGKRFRVLGDFKGFCLVELMNVCALPHCFCWPFICIQFGCINRGKREHISYGTIVRKRKKYCRCFVLMLIFYLLLFRQNGLAGF